MFLQKCVHFESVHFDPIDKRVQSWVGTDVFNEIFCILVNMRPLYKLRHVSW